MNIIPLDITNGLIDHEIGAGEYVKLLSAPTAANVTIKANRSFGNGIPLKEGHSVRARKEVRNVYISCDAIAGESIKIMQADNNDDFDLDTPPSSVDVDLIGGYEQIALDQLGKMFEPYEEPFFTYSGSGSTVSTSIFSKTLTCDKVKVTINSGMATTEALIRTSIDGAVVSRIHSSGTGESSSLTATVSGVAGKVLSVTGLNASADTFFCFVEEYYKKV